MIDEILDHISNLITKIRGEHPFIIGINGVDGSGKTHFSDNLYNFLKNRGYDVCLIHLDDFHNHKKKRREGADENQAYINNAFNLTLLQNKILNPLRNLNTTYSTEMILLDLEKDTYSINKSYQFSNQSIVLIEGVLLFREPVNQYFNLKIFLDVTFDIAIERNIIRAQPADIDEADNIEQRMNTKYIPIQKWYLNAYRVLEISDIIINNNDFNKPVLVKSTLNL